MAFGIQPARPLKIVTIQAENDEGDLIEQAKGCFYGVNRHEQPFTKDERKLIEQNALMLTRWTDANFYGLSP